MATNDILFKIDKPDLSNGIVDGYSEYLANCVCEMKFIDIANLKEYFKAHLNIFFSEAISDIDLGGYDKRLNDLKKENEQLAIDRAEMEEELLKAKSRLRERRPVDTDWMARCNYAYKMKGIRIQSNCREIGRLGDIVHKNKIAINNEKNNEEKKLFLLYAKEKLGEEEYIKWWNEIKNKMVL
jgi:ABC-type thiamine transport system substrate-binding protein